MGYRKLTGLLHAILLMMFLTSETARGQILNGFDLSEATVPPAEILQGGPPRDGIPAIDSPQFLVAEKADFLQTEDRVLGIVISGKARAYPIKILNWHEIVNDSLNGNYFVITYCPLCGTGVAFSASISGENLRFGVSGLLYNSDVLLYDRSTKSLWSQIMGQAVTGTYKGTQLQMLPLRHTNWGEWRKRHPRTEVLSTATGHHRDYNRNPYAGYETSRRLYFDVAHTSPQRFHPKEQVLGLQSGRVYKAYPFVELNRNGKSKFTDRINNKRFTIFWDSDSQSGSIQDSRGKIVPIIQGFWFAWFAFHPKTQVFNAK
jgi:hypothetical protein